METEAELKRQAKKWLDKNGWFNPNIHNEGFYCHKGMADKVVIKNGQVVMIEFKTKSKKSVQSDWQIKFQKDWESHGGRYILVRSLEDLIFELTGEKQLVI